MDSEYESHPLSNASIQEEHTIATCFPLARGCHMAPIYSRRIKTTVLAAGLTGGNRFGEYLISFYQPTLKAIIYLLHYFPPNRKHSPPSERDLDLPLLAPLLCIYSKQFL